MAQINSETWRTWKWKMKPLQEDSEPKWALIQVKHTEEDVPVTEVLEIWRVKQ